MSRNLSSATFAASLLLSGVATIAIVTPASAQYVNVSVSFNSFHDRLANYGDWIYSDRWGEVWVPETDASFSPYNSNGHWAYTDDYGWVWVSGYEWGDIAFHYGRWVNDPDDGWLWVPGYVWSPAWVAWRSNGSYVGWMPLPPDDAFLAGGESYAGNSVGIRIDFNNLNGFYGYSRWYDGYDDRRFASNWVFVTPAHLGDPQFHRYAAPSGSNVQIVQNTRNITNYTVINNYVVNRSVSVDTVKRAGGQVQPVQAAAVVRNRALITTVSAGRATQVQVRATNPHGTGVPFSAPKPTSQVASTLSARVPPRLASRPTSQHIFTRTTVASAPLPPKRGAAVAPTSAAPGAPTSGAPAGTPRNGQPTTTTPTTQPNGAAAERRNGREPRTNAMAPAEHQPRNVEPANVAPSRERPENLPTQNNGRTDHKGRYENGNAGPTQAVPPREQPNEATTDHGLKRPASETYRHRTPPADQNAPREPRNVEPANAPPSHVRPENVPTEHKGRYENQGPTQGTDVVPPRERPDNVPARGRYENERPPQGADMAPPRTHSNEATTDHGLKQPASATYRHRAPADQTMPAPTREQPPANAPSDRSGRHEDKGKKPDKKEEQP
jgi:hypothetical protein